MLSQMNKGYKLSNCTVEITQYTLLYAASTVPSHCKTFLNYRPNSLGYRK